MSTSPAGLGPESPAVNSLALAREVAVLAEDKKASDVVILDVGSTVGYTDYFVIASAGNERQIKAIHDAIYQGLKHGQPGILPARAEGLGQAQWVVLDYLDVVVHIFSEQARSFYRLEKLWGEAPRASIKVK